MLVTQSAYKNAPFNDLVEDGMPALRYPSVENHGSSQYNPACIETTGDSV